MLDRRGHRCRGPGCCDPSENGGVGLALVAAPFLILVLGPIQRVVLTNVLAVITTGTVVLTQWRVEVRRLRPLLLVAVVAVVPGAVLVRVAPQEVPNLAAGGLILMALSTGFVVARCQQVPRVAALILGDGLSGIMSVNAESDGPGAVTYAIATRWSHKSFVISVQFHLLCLGIVSLVLRGVVPGVTPWQWVAVVSGLLVGVVAGQYLEGRVPTRGVQVSTYVVAYSGALLVRMRGLRALS
ncbi:TSUP family transporter [Phycicoccus sp. KQZ13P-1]|uniref:TSUP family transporter n=1 Tax=Phycicoccus mangrovi TaxID=2840470 RepID=UPI001C005A8F|nr:TSUP family transporter [Phycicoccus mangrovi]MBT9256280.1 TSUP family transporter [Phycicoccus mangrovi]